MDTVRVDEDIQDSDIKSLDNLQQPVSRRDKYINFLCTGMGEVPLFVSREYHYWWHLCLMSVRKRLIYDRSKSVVLKEVEDGVTISWIPKEIEQEELL